MTDVASTLAQKRAGELDCPVCGVRCAPQLLEHRRRGGDEFERLACGLDEITFRRIWIAG